ncbi:metal-dependent hydrolase [Kocuria sp. M1R5S2]|uniref:metal-dependent hydrolase n=1 Tax=Kocuria rhizosphaerae TaxID=3376285 RepID=UPI0037A9E249
MMGPSHAACGAAAWVALTADYRLHLEGISIPIGWGLLDVGDAGVLTGALVTAGAALLPDLDHPGGTVARSLPPLSTWLSRVVCRIAGGHRRGTHSLLGMAAFTGLAAAAQELGVPVEGFGRVWPLAAVMSVLLIALAVQSLAFLPARVAKFNWVAGIGLGAVVGLHPPAHEWWFPAAVGTGVVVHVLGDLVTTRGVHLLYPLRAPLPLPRSVYRNRSFVAVPLLGNAGSVAELALLAPVTLFALTGLWGALALVTGLAVA